MTKIYKSVILKTKEPANAGIEVELKQTDNDSNSTNTTSFTNKSLIFYIMLGLFFILSFEILKYFPVLLISREVWVVLVMSYLFLIVIPKKIMNNGLKFSFFELYVLALLILMPVYSAIMAKLVFGQPLLHGILSQRLMFITGSSLILINLVREKKIALIDIEKVLVSLGWVCMIGFIAITLFYNPAEYGNVSGFIRGGGILKGGVMQPYHFVFNAVFIVYTLLFYFNRALIRKGIRDYLLIVPFIMYLVFIDGGRALLLSLFFAIGVSIVSKVSIIRIIIWAPISILSISIIVGSMYYTQGEYMNKFENKFIDAVTVVTTGEKSSDPSANARIDETKAAWPYIKRNWIFGNGDLSHQWQSGYSSKLGYFAPSDLGLIGTIYMFGVVGVLFFLLQFVYGWKYIKSIKKDKRTLLADTSNTFLIYFFCISLVTGSFVYSVYVSAMFVSILYLVYLDSKAIVNNNCSSRYIKKLKRNKNIGHVENIT